MMSAPPVLIFGLSKPTNISEGLWTEWYTTERLPQLVEKGIATRAALYREILFPGTPPVQREHDFLVLVQTNIQEGHETQLIAELPTTSEIFSREGSDLTISKNHLAEVRDYTLVQDYCPGSPESGMSTPILWHILAADCGKAHH